MTGAYSSRLTSRVEGAEQNVPMISTSVQSHATEVIDVDPPVKAIVSSRIRAMSKGVVHQRLSRNTKSSEPRSPGRHLQLPYRAFLAASVTLHGTIQSRHRTIRAAGRYDDSTAAPR